MAFITAPLTAQEMKSNYHQKWTKHQLWAKEPKQQPKLTGIFRLTTGKKYLC